MGITTIINFNYSVGVFFDSSDRLKKDYQCFPGFRVQCLGRSSQEECGRSWCDSVLFLGPVWYWWGNYSTIDSSRVRCHKWWGEQGESEYETVKKSVTEVDVIWRYFRDLCWSSPALFSTVSVSPSLLTLLTSSLAESNEDRIYGRVMTTSISITRLVWHLACHWQKIEPEFESNMGKTGYRDQK